MRSRPSTIVAAALLCATAAWPASVGATTYVFQTVANNGDTIPQTSKLFNSFNQPSIDNACRVVLRGRSKGEEKPARGVYTRKMCASPTPLREVIAVGDRVPSPNNTESIFNEFPAFPRVDATSGLIATRGQSRPVWEYTLPDGSDTRIGVAGIYIAALGKQLATGEAQLGGVPGFPYFAVPGAPAGTKFDQFPGAPSPTWGKYIVFKGNYTEGDSSKTGVYYRNALGGAGSRPTYLIANTNTRIPNQASGGNATFGSTAPPSAAAGKAVFLGTDNEDAPTLGGIYLAKLVNKPTLRTLVGIGGSVPGVSGQTFTGFGEGLSFDGRFVGFWGSWGTATRTVTLTCPTDGNPDLLAVCKDKTVQVPVNQGIFVHDLSNGSTKLIVRTGAAYRDFLFWVFSGRPPGTGDDEGTLEAARWRSSAFVAVQRNGTAPATAFKALQPNGVQGIFLRPRPTAEVRTVLATGSDARRLDPEAPAGSLVTALGIERDGFRGCKLALNASMLNAATSASWAGVYVLKSGACRG